MRAAMTNGETAGTAETTAVCSHCHSMIEVGQELYTAAQWSTVRHADMDACRAGREAHAQVLREQLGASLRASDARTAAGRAHISRGYVPCEGER